jgi:Zn ribbon nucleic-acid-binding protein
MEICPHCNEKDLARMTEYNRVLHVDSCLEKHKNNSKNSSIKSYFSK